MKRFDGIVLSLVMLMLIGSFAWMISHVQRDTTGAHTPQITTTPSTTGVRIFVPVIKKDPTLIPTPIPTPTMVPTPTTVPSPTATTEPEIEQVPSPNVTFLTSSTYTDVNNGLYIIGEYRNDTGRTIQTYAIEAQYFDKSGKLLATSMEPGYSLPAGIGPGEVAPYSVYIRRPGGYSYHTVRMFTAGLTTAPPPSGITVLSTTDHPDSFESLVHHVDAVVRNDTGSPVEYRMVVATAYDTNGVLIGLGVGSVGNADNPVQPGQEIEVDIRINHVAWSNVKRYSVVAK